MASWISRALTRLAERSPEPAAPPLPPAEVHAAIEAAKRAISKGDFPAARATLRDVVISNPDDVDVLAYYGMAAFRSGDPADARVALARAVRIDPDHMFAQKHLALVYNELHDLQKLEVAASEALRLAPRDLNVLNLYGIARMNRHDVDGAAQSFSTAIEVAPNDMAALMNLEQLSVRTLLHRRTLEHSPKVAAARSQAINRLRAQYRRGTLDDEGLRSLLLLLGGAEETFPAGVELAQKVCGREQFSTGLADVLASVFAGIGDLSNLVRFRRIVADQDSSLPMAKSHLAYASLILGYGHWRESWKAARAEEHLANLGVFAKEVPSWTGQRLGRKKILVYQEQGIGDAIIALRLIPMLAKRGVHFDLWVMPPLGSLASSIKGYENLFHTPARPNALELGCEYASTLFGLISALDVDHQELFENPTVLSASANRATSARERLRALPGRRVGLAYGGNPKRRDDWFRAVPSSALKPLAAIDGISWVNLSIDDRPDRPEVIRIFRMDDPMKEASDFADTAAIISELDAVIAIDSSVAHLACSLGKPVWVLLPPMVDWRWQVGSDTKVWWPNATVLRSSKPGVWDGVIEDLVKQVGAWR